MKTYEEVMRERLEDGKGPRVINEDVIPGVKNVLAGKVRSGGSGINGQSKASVPTVPVVSMPAVLKGKDLSVDYLGSSRDKAATGDYAGAMYDEMLHNEKNGYLGLGYENSHIFNYDNPYQGELDRQKAALENREPFSYDYRTDDVYKTLRAQKEKEAEKAYKDGYAQLSTAFDGDIPVNMINKLITSKAEITDQADSYIPTLKQMAYQMYQDEGDRMYQNYGLTQNAAAEDYSRWLTDRDYITSGYENKYARDAAREQYEDEKSRDDRNFDYQKSVDDRNFDYQKNMQDISLRYGVGDTIANIALNLYNSGKANSLESAVETAKLVENLYK